MLAPPLQLTFDLLANSANEASADLLLAALDAGRDDVRQGAVSALLHRPEPEGRRELLHRFHELDETAVESLTKHDGRLTRALHDCLLGDDDQAAKNACLAAVRLRIYDALPSLLEVAESDVHARATLASRAVLTLADLLYGELSREGENHSRELERNRDHAITALEESVVRFARHRRTEAVEGFLTLASRDNAALSRLLHDKRDPGHDAILDALAHSDRPGVLRLLLNILDHPNAAPAALDAAAHRTQRKFLYLLLRKARLDSSSAFRHNLARLKDFLWLRDDDALLRNLDEESQCGLVALIMPSGVPRERVCTLLGRILAVGQPAARRAAAAAVAELDGSEANSLALLAVNDKDPGVRALGADQIRRRGVPGALSMLLELIDDSAEEVRKTARENLGEFSVDKLLASFDTLDEDARKSTGELVKRVDEHTIPKIREALHSPVRRSRVRALAVVTVLEIGPEVEDDLIALTLDADHVVRMEAARALGECRSHRARDSVLALRDDPSAPVREAAANALSRFDSNRSTNPLSSPYRAKS